MYYREHPKQIDEIARELGVDAVVEMSVRRVEDNVRITVQLIDGESQQHLWSQPYDRRYSASEIFAIQEDVARQIAAELRVQLTGEEEARLGEVPTQNTQAYELYLRASARLRGGGSGPREDGIDLLRQAVALDPDFAAAWATMSVAMLNLVVDWNKYDLAR